jgi:hypothetical protein
MEPAVVNYPKYTRGDTVKAKRFTLATVEANVSTPIDLTGALISVTFDDNIVKIKKTIGNGITVIDAINGVFEIDSMVFQNASTYKYDINIKFSDNSVKTYIKGSITIVNDITK